MHKTLIAATGIFRKNKKNGTEIKFGKKIHQLKDMLGNLLIHKTGKQNFISFFKNQKME